MLDARVGQFRLGSAAVTNKPQIQTAEYSKGLVLAPIACLLSVD